MPGFRPGNFTVALGFNDSLFTAGLTRAAAQLNTFTRTVATTGPQRLRVFGDAATRLGSTLTRSLTLPLAAAGAAATKLGLDFERGLTRVSTLTGLAVEDAEALGDQLVEVADRSATSLTNLSDSLLVAVSAGFRGTEAIELTESAARLAAIGLGELDQVTRALTVTLENYAGSGVSASRAADILLATAQQGNFQASQLANAFGMLLANASSLGAGLEDVSASFAALTLFTGNARTAQTRLSGVFRTFLKPTVEARAALDQVGLSVDEVRRQLGDEGLHRTLTNISTALRGAGIDLSAVFADSEALAGVLSLTSETSKLPQILDGIRDSTGQVEQRFAQWSETSEGRLRQAMTDLSTAGTQLGSEVLPVVASAASGVASAISGLSDFLGDLSPEMRAAVIALGGLTAAAPLAIAALGRLSTAIVSVRKAVIALRAPGALLGLGPLLAGPAGLAAGAGIAGAALVGFFATLDDGDEPLRQSGTLIDALTDSLQRVGEQADITLQGILGITDGGLRTEHLDRLTSSADVLRERLATELRVDGSDIFSADTIIAAAREVIGQVARNGIDADAQIEALQRRISEDAFESGGNLFSAIGNIFSTTAGRAIGAPQDADIRALESIEAITDLLYDQGARRGQFGRGAGARTAAGDAIRQALEDVAAVADVISTEEERIRGLVVDVEPAFRASLNPTGLIELNRILDLAADTGLYSDAARSLVELANAYGITIDQTEDLEAATRSSANVAYSTANAYFRTAAALRQTSTAAGGVSRSLRSVLGLDTEALEEEEALQNLVESQAQAALLALGNGLTLDPSSGLLDQYNQATIDAIQDWFAAIDRYATRLGRTGQLTALDSVIGQQLDALMRLRESLPDQTYQRLLTRLRNIGRAAREGESTGGGGGLGEALEPVAAHLTAIRDGFVIVEDRVEEVRQGFVGLVAGATGFGQAAAGARDEWRATLDAFDDLPPPTIETTLAPPNLAALRGLVAGVTGIPSVPIDTSLTPPSQREVDAAWRATQDRLQANPLNISVSLLLNTAGAQQALAGLVAGAIGNIGGGGQQTGGRDTTGDRSGGRDTTDDRGGGRDTTGDNRPGDTDGPRDTGGSGRREIGRPTTTTTRSGRTSTTRTYYRNGRIYTEIRTGSGTRTTSRRATPEEISAYSAGIPLAEGGIAVRPTLGLIGEAGEPEAIVPLSRASELGFGGQQQPVVINIYGDFYGDERQFRDLVLTSLRDDRRLNGARSVEAL